MDEEGCRNRVLLFEGAQCGGPLGKVPLLGTLEDMLRKALDTGISLHRGPFMYEGNMESGGVGLVSQGPVGGGTGCNIGRSCCTAELLFWRTSHTLNTKFPFSTVCFLGVSGLTVSSYILCDCTPIGHKGTIEYICNVYFYIHYTYISFQYIYLFMMH